MFPATGQDWAQYTCDDAFTGTKLDETEVTFVGGIQNPQRTLSYSIADIAVAEGDMAVFVIKRRGKTDIASSIRYSTRDGSATEDLDYQETSGFLGFAPGETEKEITVRTFRDAVNDNFEDFFMRIFRETPSNIRTIATKTVARCTIIQQYTNVSDYPDGIGGIYQPSSPNPIFPSRNPGREDLYGEADVPTDADNGTTITDNADGTTTVSSGTTETDEVITPNPIYEVTADKASVKEGQFVTYTIKTKYVPFGTVLSYTLFGTGIKPTDIVSGSMTGTFVVEDLDLYNAKVVVGIADDLEFENSEVLTFGIDGTGARISVLIESDSSTLSEEEIASIEDASIPIPTLPDEPKSPTTGPPITGPRGEIIYIPIEDNGDPYKEPPTVLISGNGTRAVAIALTDENGIVQEIRVTDPGYDYKINDPVTANKECIIDSFTMIRPGRLYESAPTVFVDGDPTVADAVINDKGQVISVSIKNRELMFSDYPEVKILGGGGYGAKFLPSLACLDPAERVRIGSAKIGTGSYIDCP